MAQRALDHSAESELWEFPGGKVEPGENTTVAIAREIAEELGVNLANVQPIAKARAVDSRRGIALNLLSATLEGGQPICRVHQALRWVPPHACVSLPMGHLDRQLAKWAAAPHTYHISRPDQKVHTGAAICSPQSKRAWVLARWPDASEQTYAHQLAELLAAVPELPVMLHDRRSPDLQQANVVGTHLSGRQAAQHRERPFEAQKWLAISCHNQEELAHAQTLEADFAVLGPVRKTPSHPGADAMGWTRFAELASHARLPVLALGGVQTADLTTVQALGGYGVAGISSFWQS